MAKHGDYKEIVVESFMPSETSGRHGKVHVRPVEGQFYPQTLFVECAKRLTEDYPVGTRFKLRVKLTDREGSGEYLYSYFGWPFQVIK
jgi:hypothetical protein